MFGETARISLPKLGQWNASVADFGQRGTQPQSGCAGTKTDTRNADATDRFQHRTRIRASHIQAARIPQNVDAPVRHHKEGVGGRPSQIVDPDTGDVVAQNGWRLPFSIQTGEL